MRNAPDLDAGIAESCESPAPEAALFAGAGIGGRGVGGFTPSGISIPEFRSAVFRTSTSSKA